MIQIEQILTYLGFEEFTNLFVYFQDEKKFKYFNNGKFVETKVPDLLTKYLYDEKCSFHVFRKEHEILLFYFFRIEIYNAKYVIILQDNNEGEYLNKFVSVIFENLMELKGEVVQLNKEIDFLRDELSVCEKELAIKDNEKRRLEDELNNKISTIESLTDSVNILRKSRQKMLKLIDGFNMPFFSMDLSYDITNVNRALGNFVDENNLPRLVGSKCYKIVFNNSEPCSWCKFKEVAETKAPVKQHISTDKNGKKMVFEQTLYPIFDENGVIIEYGEYLNDISEQYELINSLKISEEKLSTITKKNLEKISEINELKKAYYELSDEYEKAKDKISKISKVLNTLLQQDTINELLELRTRNKELEIKLNKALTTIQNYTKKHDEYRDKMEELSKKSVYSIERLYNIISNKKTIEDEELKKVFDFLGSQILYIKNMLEKKGGK